MLDRLDFWITVVAIGSLAYFWVRDRLGSHVDAVKAQLARSWFGSGPSPRRVHGLAMTMNEDQHSENTWVGHQPMTGAARDWLWDLVEAPHALIVGQTRAGKTVLTPYSASERAKRGHRVLVCDPDARPGMWPGCRVVGGGDRFEDIEQHLQELSCEIQARREQRSRGVRRFPSITLVLSEVSDIIASCPTARPLLEAILRRGAKLGISLLVDVQDAQVRTLDLPGVSHLLNNFTLRLEVRKVDGQRIARLEDTVYLVPLLQDPEQLADQFQRHLLTNELRTPDREPGPGKLHQLAGNADGAPGGCDVRVGRRKELLVEIPKSRVKAIRELVALGASRNQIAAVMGMGRAKVLTLIEAAVGEEAQGRQESSGTMVE